MENEKTQIKSFRLYETGDVAVVYHDGTQEKTDMPKSILEGLSESERYDMARLWLKEAGYEFTDKPKEEPKEKRPYHKHQKFTLSPANQIVLVPAYTKPVGPQKYTLFRIVWKANKRYISAIGPKGFETIANEKRAMLFTKEDVGMVANETDFDFEPVEVIRAKKPVSLLKRKVDKANAGRD